MALPHDFFNILFKGLAGLGQINRKIKKTGIIGANGHVHGQGVLGVRHFGKSGHAFYHTIILLEHHEPLDPQDISASPVLDVITSYSIHYTKLYDLKMGAPIEEAFRLAVNEFEGSHAISMHTDLAPGKLFLAQKGSGQAIFVGLAPDHYIAASELYGVVEETRHYIKLNGEEKGQIVILDQESPGGIEGVRSFYYDNQPITLTGKDVLKSQISYNFV